MVSHRDPAAMTPQERFNEVAAILAKGYLRYRKRRHLEDAASSPTPKTPPPEGTGPGESR